MSKNLIVILIIFFGIIGSNLAQGVIIKEIEDYISEDFQEILFISIKNQKMYHLKKSKNNLYI